jgi:hypothetical protein
MTLASARRRAGLVLGAVHADQPVQAGMVVGLVAHVQRADARRATHLGDRLAGRAQVAVADVGAQPARQRGDPPAAQQRQARPWKAHARRQRGATAEPAEPMTWTRWPSAAWALARSMQCRSPPAMRDENTT